MSKTSCWIEAVRLRTLPVSLAGVVTGASLAIFNHTFRWAPVVIGLLFATLAQVASNFANEYFDYRDGLDRKGRAGPRRGVTEGDIKPAAMRNAALGTLAAAAIIGCSLIYWGGWWLIAAGIAIILGALAYSAGPYPLSRHALGEVAVVVFFGIAPVTLTYYLQAGDCPIEVWLASIAVGLLGANVLIVNNYRDADDDRAVGKITLAVKFGRTFTGWLYLANCIAAVILMLPIWKGIHLFGFYVWLACAFAAWRKLRNSDGSALNPLLGGTAMLMLAYALLALAASLIH